VDLSKGMIVPSLSKKVAVKAAVKVDSNPAVLKAHPVVQQLLNAEADHRILRKQDLHRKKHKKVKLKT
jgi:hypothetical protein